MTNRRFLATLLLAGAGCATTTVAPAGAPQAPRWIAADAPPETGAEPADRGADAASVVVQASSPTDVQCRTDASDVVVPLSPRQPAAGNRRTVAAQAKWIGLGMGVLAGGLIGYGNDHRSDPASPPPECDTGFGCGGGGGSVLGIVA